jgi:hypothetical protein
MGGIIGSAEIVDCVASSNSPWFYGKYGFVIRNASLWDEFVPCVGRLGFFAPDYSLKYGVKKVKAVEPKPVKLVERTLFDG